MNSTPLEYWSDIHPDSLRSLRSLSVSLSQPSWYTSTEVATFKVLKTMVHIAAERLSHLTLSLPMGRGDTAMTDLGQS